MLVWIHVTRATTSRTVGALLCVLLSQVAHAAPASAPLLNPASVVGPQVTLSWSAVPGATGYRLSVGTAPGTEGYAYPVGAVTTVTFNSPFVGTGYVRLQAFDATGLGPVSNEVPLTVSTLSPAPAAPVGLQASLSGQTVNLSWGPGAGGGAPQAVVLEAGTFPGGANLGAVPLPLSTRVSVPGVAPGTYFIRVYAANASGRSGASNEVRIDMPTGGGCTAPTASSLSVSVSGTTVSFAWAPVAGAAGYRLEVASGPSGPVIVAQNFGAGTTAVSYPGAPAGTFYARVVSGSSCGALSASAVTTFSVAGMPTGGGPRTPDPPAGQRLPLPNMTAVVDAVARAYPGDLRNSCLSSGGNRVWLYRLVQALRRYDTRWGLNWKRGNVGDPSDDVVDYNFGPGADEGTTNVYIVDVIGGHCGSNPTPAWIDNTEATRRAGTIGRWTLQPYIAAGGQP
jgi:hypothetical protein